MPLVGNKVTERDLREHLDTLGYAGKTARIERLDLVAIERPGWVQVFRFVCEARKPEAERETLRGLIRDDERNQTEFFFFDDEAGVDAKFDELSENLITLRRSGSAGEVNSGAVLLTLVVLGAALFTVALLAG